MTSKAKTIDEYIAELPEDRKDTIEKLRTIIQKNLPIGFKEEMSYGMIGYVVPHEIYPAGYHCSPDLPLPFLSLASQKASINLYHMGVYAKPDLLNWFVLEYQKIFKNKIDMGKSCIRFKKMDSIPFDLIGELVSKMSVEDWISTYENAFLKKSI